MSFAWHEIRDHLMYSSSKLPFQRNFDAIRRNQAVLVPFRDPAALLDGLHRTQGDQGRKNLILAALVEAAQGDGPASDCALTLLLLALWPGLDAIRRRSIWRRIGPADEIPSDVLARTVEAVRGLDLGRVTWIAATILRNVERDIVRARQREVARERLASDVEPDDVSIDLIGGQPAPEATQLQNDLHKLLGTDALLVIRVAIEGFSQVEVAVELGLTEVAARKRYQRAMRKLRAALQEIH
jgi:DNA-directed RNA polymerase specialized sigma24 family protein